MYYLVNRHNNYEMDIWLFKYINSPGIKLYLVRDADAKPFPDDLTITKDIIKLSKKKKLNVNFLKWKEQKLNEYPWKQLLK